MNHDKEKTSSNIATSHFRKVRSQLSNVGLESIEFLKIEDKLCF